jgi:hypothetical protein
MGDLMMDVAKTAQRREEIRLVVKFPAQVLSTLIGRLRLARSEAFRGNRARSGLHV